MDEFKQQEELKMFLRKDLDAYIATHYLQDECVPAGRRASNVCANMSIDFQMLDISACEERDMGEDVCDNVLPDASESQEAIFAKLKESRRRKASMPRPCKKRESAPKPREMEDTLEDAEEVVQESLMFCREIPPKDLQTELDKLLHRKQETFAELLQRFIQERGLTDVETYKRALLTKQAFSRLRDPKHHPKKPTVLALIIALELDMREAKELLEVAGYTFMPNDLQDVIVNFFVEKGYYDIYYINEVLYERGVKLLGTQTR